MNRGETAKSQCSEREGGCYKGEQDRQCGMFLVFPPVFGFAVVKDKIQPKAENQNQPHNGEEAQRNIKAGQHR
jgi:hypothetical protein